MDVLGGGGGVSEEGRGMMVDGLEVGSGLDAYGRVHGGWKTIRDRDFGGWRAAQGEERTDVAASHDCRDEAVALPQVEDYLNPSVTYSQCALSTMVHLRSDPNLPLLNAQNDSRNDSPL